MTLGPAHPVRPVPAQPGHLSNVQILRGIAAVMVLVYHIGNEFSDRGFPGTFPDVGAGSAGVDIFFVLSGFIMVYSTASAFGARGAPALFLARRIVRLVPLYWLVTTVFVVVSVREAPPAGLTGETWRWFAASYAFLFYPHGAERGDFPLYAQGWTLNFEMLFYACFTAMLPFRRGPALWTLSLGLVGFTLLGLATPLPWPADRWANTDILEFVLGIGLAAVHARGARLSLPVAVGLAGVGLATFALTVAWVDDWLPYRGFVWGPPACAVVAAAALYTPSRGGTLRAALETLGDASYALYLVHYAFFLGLGDALDRFVPVATLPPTLYGSLCFCGAIALAFAVHRFIERPMARGLDRALGLSRRWRALGGAAAVVARPVSVEPK